MTYTLEWSATSRRTLSTLPEKVAIAVVEFIYATLVESPARVGKPLRFELEGLHSARRGDYRVVYRFDTESINVTIMAIQHRADVYRPR